MVASGAVDSRVGGNHTGLLKPAHRPEHLGRHQCAHGYQATKPDGHAHGNGHPTYRDPIPLAVTNTVANSHLYPDLGAYSYSHAHGGADARARGARRGGGRGLG